MPAYGLSSGTLGEEEEGPKRHSQSLHGYPPRSPFLESPGRYMLFHQACCFYPPLVCLHLHLHHSPPTLARTVVAGPNTHCGWVDPSLALPHPTPPPPNSLLSDLDSKEDCVNAWDCSCLIQSDALVDSKCSKDCDTDAVSATPIFGSGTNLPHETDSSSHKESLNGFTQKIPSAKEGEEESENKASSSNSSNTSKDCKMRERRDDVFLRKKLLVNSIHCLSQVLSTESLEDDDAYRLQNSISSLSSCLLNLFGHNSHGKNDLGELDQVSVRGDPEGSDESCGHDDEIHAPGLGPVLGSLDKNDGITNEKNFSSTMPDHLSLLQNHLFILRDDLKMLRAWLVDMQQDFSLTMFQILTLLSKPKVSAEPLIATVSHTDANDVEASNEMEQKTSAIFTVDDGDHVNILFSADEGVYTEHPAVESLEGNEILQEEPIIEMYFNNARDTFQDSARMSENTLSHSDIDGHSLMEDEIQNVRTTNHESKVPLPPKGPDSHMPRSK